MRRLMAGLMVTTLVVATSLVPLPARAGSGLLWPVGPSPSTSASSQPCASLLFVGVRGSGEPVPYGDTVTRVRNNIREATSTLDGTARELWVDYPAANPHELAGVPLDQLLLGDELPETSYFDSVLAGADQLRAVLADSASRCPDERVVVAGFSQGAEVVSTAVAGADPTRFAGVVVAGNPANTPVLPGSREGDAEPNSFGLTATLFYLRAGVARARSGATNPIGAAVQSALDLRAREPDRAQAEAAARAEQVAAPEGFADVWHHVCLAGDLACDAGPALSRILSTQTTMDQEIDETRIIHLSYNEGRLRPATDAVAARLAGEVAPPRNESGAGVGPGSPWAAWLPWALVGLVGGGFGAGLLVGRFTARGLPGRRRREVEPPE